VRDPARQAADREEHREHPGREAHGLVDDAGVEVDVRVELALPEVVVVERDVLELLGDVQQVVLDAEGGEHLVGALLDERRARVVVLIHPVAEAHQANAVLLVLDPLDVLLDALAGCLDLAEHLEDGLIGAAVQRPEQRVDARGNRREQVGLGRTDEAHGRGRRVLLVVLVQHEQTLERAADDRVHLVGLGVGAEVELEEVVDEAQRVVGVQERLADALLVRVRGHDRQLGEQANRRDLDLRRVLRTERVLVVRRQRRNAGGEHRHRVRVVRQRIEEAAQVLVQQGVTTDAGVELVEFTRAGQLAVNEQPGRLEEARVLGDLLDRVAAIAEDALLAVDEGDRRAGGRRVDEPRVERGEPGLAGEGGDVDAGRTVGGLQDRELGAPSGEREGGLLRLGGWCWLCDVAHGASLSFCGLWRYAARHFRCRATSTGYSLIGPDAYCRIHQDSCQFVSGGPQPVPRRADARRRPRSARRWR